MAPRTASLAPAPPAPHAQRNPSESAAVSSSSSASSSAQAGKPRRKWMRWTDDEVAALLSGVVKHGVGAWSIILADNEFQFDPRRTCVDLKDKYVRYLTIQWVEKVVLVMQNAPPAVIVTPTHLRVNIPLRLTTGELPTASALKRSREDSPLAAASAPPMATGVAAMPPVMAPIFSKFVGNSPYVGAGSMPGHMSPSIAPETNTPFGTAPPPPPFSNYHEPLAAPPPFSPPVNSHASATALPPFSPTFDSRESVSAPLPFPPSFSPPGGARAPLSAPPPFAPAPFISNGPRFVSVPPPPPPTMRGPISAQYDAGFAPVATMPSAMVPVSIPALLPATLLSTGLQDLPRSPVVSTMTMVHSTPVVTHSHFEPAAQALPESPMDVGDQGSEVEDMDEEVQDEYEQELGPNELPPIPFSGDSLGFGLLDDFLQGMEQWGGTSWSSAAPIAVPASTSQPVPASSQAQSDANIVTQKLLAALSTTPDRAPVPDKDIMIRLAGVDDAAWTPLMTRGLFDHPTAPIETVTSAGTASAGPGTGSDFFNVRHHPHPHVAPTVAPSTRIWRQFGVRRQFGLRAIARDVTRRPACDSLSALTAYRASTPTSPLLSSRSASPTLGNLSPRSMPSGDDHMGVSLGELVDAALHLDPPALASALAVMRDKPFSRPSFMSAARVTATTSSSSGSSWTCVSASSPLSPMPLELPPVAGIGYCGMPAATWAPKWAAGGAAAGDPYSWIKDVDARLRHAGGRPRSKSQGDLS
ncbi:hypothetical protein AMAG_14887 [Allomyces macrogynus ATCC 38327]|uniref:Myb-like domain-containing protein n=1 Tax=Allomyces macrogynus (strain ATCC 38327) TaxID=578462 RepID=A0A0L0T874_ALLM3|nr:hypothetical protein AMAG_14887 [Allomyces macrogynus ATCC 38327]|eukprot:KNE70764.1 hypothetical protein AMAG_14887 [Allomyces macrogynus ATCC 38327]